MGSGLLVFAHSSEVCIESGKPGIYRILLCGAFEGSLSSTIPIPETEASRTLITAGVHASRPTFNRSSLAAFPSYNVVLGFWGLYSVFTRSLQAIQV